MSIISRSLRRALDHAAVRAAAAAVVASAALLGVALWHALRPLPATSAMSTRRDGPGESAAPGRLAGHVAPPFADSSADAEVRDPFRPSAGRVGQDEAAVAAAPPAAAPAIPAPAVRLVGTVVDQEGGSFAVLQSGDAPSRVVRAGERFGEYRLMSVSPGGAVLAASDGKRLTLRVRQEQR